jgi:uncharacterized protein
MSPAIAVTGGTAAERLVRESAPGSPAFHLIPDSRTALVVDGSRLFQLDESAFDRLRLAEAEGWQHPELLLSELDLLGTPAGCEEVPVRPPVRALSLAIAQKCNLGCSYCYASQGDFGSTPKSMSANTALLAVNLLFADAPADSRVNLAFLGGEPLLNRDVLRQATEYAAMLAQARNVHVAFSITTNGTLLTEEDAAFFETHGFAVTLSLDGPRDVHDALRPYKGGAGSYDRIVSNARTLLARQRRMQVSARVTVTSQNLSLLRTLNEFISLGFHSVGFSPLLNAFDGTRELDAASLRAMLAQMVECGREFERRLLNGERYPFSNIVNALREIHRGTHRPYPCGAGAGYLGVSADGELAACHRFVGEPRGAMGNLVTGIDPAGQSQWLTERHVHRQEPCNRCWARYMCGGGCHHEVLSKGRPACDYIRGWLHYCLEAYVRLRSEAPEWFSGTPGPEHAL